MTSNKKTVLLGGMLNSDQVYSCVSLSKYTHLGHGCFPKEPFEYEDRKSVNHIFVPGSFGFPSRDPVDAIHQLQLQLHDVPHWFSNHPFYPTRTKAKFPPSKDMAVGQNRPAQFFPLSMNRMDVTRHGQPSRVLIG